MFDQKLVLIVEDEAIVALDLASAVEALCGRVAGPASTVVEALELIVTHDIAAAVLDCHLVDRDVTPVVIALSERGVPFVIHTGTELPPELAALRPLPPVLHKPQQPVIVLACLLNEIRERGAQQLMD